MFLSNLDQVNRSNDRFLVTHIFVQSILYNTQKLNAFEDY